MPIVETEDWLLRVPPAEAGTLLLAAMEAAGLSARRDGDGTIRAEGRQSLRRNRWKSKLDVTLEPAGAGTRARCRVDMAGDKHLDVMDEITAGIDPGLFDDRGAGAAADRVGGLERRELRGVRSQIGADETVEALGKGMHERQGAIVALTDRRLLLYARTRRGESSEELARSAVASLEAARGTSGDRLVIRAADRRIEVERMRPGHAEALVAAFGAPPAAAGSPGEPDPLDQLRRLRELRDAGVVTPEEFEAKKAKLLDRI